MIEFLGFFSTLKQLLSGNVDIVIFTILRSIFYMLCTLIYRMISYVYDIFIALCNGQLLDSDTLNTLFGRFGMLLGVIMMFRVAFSFIQVLINPDSFSDNQKGIPKIVTKVIIVIIMFGLSSYVFDFLRDVQGEIIESNVIPKFLLPVEVNTKDFGSTLSAEFFTAFYNLHPDLDYATSDPCAQQDYIDGLKGEIQKNNNFSYNRAQCLNATGTIKQTGDEEFFIEFNFIFALLAGIAILYFLFSYCISVGTRIIQLAVLQIIAPMAIVGYLSPKQDNLFTKWYKLYFATYIDAFIRIAIINFIVYLCGLILEGWNSGNSVFWSSVGMPSGFTKILIGIMMIMALLSFAKKAPELIKNLFPDGAAGLGLGTGNVGTKAFLGGLVGSAVGTLGRVPGVVGNVRDAKGFKGKASALGTGLAGVGLGAVTGVARGGHAGYGAKGALSALSSGGAAQGKANLARAQRIGAGVGFGRYYGDKALNALGIETSGDNFDRQLKKYNETISFHKEAKNEAESEILKNSSNYNDGYNTLAELDIMRNDQNLALRDRLDAKDRYEKLLKAATNYSFDNDGTIVTDGFISFDLSRDTFDDRYVRDSEKNTTVSTRISVLGGSAKAAKDAKDAAQEQIDKIQTNPKYRNRISGK